MDSTMGEASKLILRNFRCFHDEQRARLRPITFLVGENSTGKTSFLAGYAAINQCFKNRIINDEPDFNHDPFELGSFDDIVYSADEKGAGLEEFCLGMNFEINSSSRNNPAEVYIQFRQKTALPYVHSIKYRFDKNDYIEFERDQDFTKIKLPKYSLESKLDLAHTHYFIKEIADQTTVIPQDAEQNISTQIVQSMIGYNSENSQKEVTHLVDYLRRITKKYSTRDSNGLPLSFRNSGILPLNTREIVASAPVRSKPKRTYNPIRELPNSEGDHIPLLIMHLSKGNPEVWKQLRQRLIEFGKTSGLFSDIRVKSYGNGGNSPFDVQVKVRSGKFTNIMDVGYGVSQCLPVIINIVYHQSNGLPSNSVFFLQQPEVHMHPRALAELSNFVCDAFQVSGNRFVIETHNDFIVDRMRLLVRDGVVDKNDISIIYFEPNGSSVNLHNLELDEDGNLLDCPPSYRQFFLKEVNKFIGLDE